MLTRILSSLLRPARSVMALLLAMALTATLIAPHAQAYPLCEDRCVTAAAPGPAPGGAPAHGHDDSDQRDCPCLEEASLSSCETSPPVLREGSVPAEAAVAHPAPPPLPTVPVPIHA